MKALLVATGGDPASALLQGRWPSALLPLVDRPFLQHVIEYLASQEIRDIEFILCQDPERYTQLIGTGQRWGCTFRTHLVRDPMKPYGILRNLLQEHRGIVLVGVADRLPGVCLKPQSDQITVFVDREKKWTGWAALSSHAGSFISASMNENELGMQLLKVAQGQGELRSAEIVLDVRHGVDYLASQELALEMRLPGLLLSGNDVDPGIWISRNVSLHPTAVLTPPVFISENCSIGSGVQLGPNAVVGKNCVLENHCIVNRSTIFAHSYIGEGLELQDVVVDRNLLHNTRLGATLTVSESFILGSLNDSPVRDALRSLARRLAACVLLFPGIPVLALLLLLLKLFGSGTGLRRVSRLKLPANADRVGWTSYKLFYLGKEYEDIGGWAATTPNWRSFFCQLLPGMLNVACGDLHLVGLPPRDPSSVDSLPRDWREVYVRSVGGLVTEMALLPEPPSLDDAYSADAYYAACRSLRRDLRLLARYLGRVLLSVVKWEAPPHSEPSHVEG